MKVGEKWRAIKSEVEKLAPWDRSGTLIQITRLYRDDEEMQDYVEYVILEDDDYNLNEFGDMGAIGGGMKREELLKCYRRDNEN